MNITTCPTCGSKRIRKVTRSLKRALHGHTVSIPGVRIHECPDCGERLYSPDALRKIQTYTQRRRVTA